MFQIQVIDLYENYILCCAHILYDEAFLRNLIKLYFSFVKNGPIVYVIINLWSRVLLEKLTVALLVKKSPVFYGT
jgi:hypothetical protein